MKKLVLSLLAVGSLSSCGDYFKTETYCGTVIERYVSGEKYGTNHTVIFYCPRINRNISVEVNMQDYGNEQIGKTVCYDLQRFRALGE